MKKHSELLTVLTDHQYPYIEEDDDGTYYSCKCGVYELQDPEDDRDLQEWHIGHLALELEEALELDLV